MRIADARFWIIGASAGIGRATALALAEQGAKLCVSARDEAALQSLVAELKGQGHSYATCDVTDLQSIQTAYAELTQKDEIEGVIYFAGMYEPMGWDAWDLDTNLRTLDVNLAGSFRLIDVLRPDMDRGVIRRLILTGSVAGYRGLPKALSYGASKSALNYMAEALRLDVEKIGTKIQLICPGFVKTRLTEKNTFAMPCRITPEEAAEAIVKGIEKGSFEIHFPRRFTYFMKLLNLLPHSLYYALLRRL